MTTFEVVRCEKCGGEMILAASAVKCPHEPDPVALLPEVFPSPVTVLSEMVPAGAVAVSGEVGPPGAVAAESAVSAVFVSGDG